MRNLFRTFIGAATTVALAATAAISTAGAAASEPTFTGPGNAFAPLIHDYSLGLAAWSWGAGADNRLGNGETGNLTIPAAANVPAGQVALGNDFGVVIDEGGVLHAWGARGLGQLGLGYQATLAVNPTNFPTASFGAGSGTAQDGDTDFFASVLPVGQHWVREFTPAEGSGEDFEAASAAWEPWEDEETGTVANVFDIWDAVEEVYVPRVFTRVAAGGDFVLALASDGTLWSWGGNAHGQLGRGYVGDAVPQHLVDLWAPAYLGTPPSAASGAGQVTPARLAHFLPRQVMTGVVDIAATLTSGHALTASGAVYSWGSNTNGQTALGLSAGNTLLPALVDLAPLGAGAHVVGISAGRNQLFLEVSGAAIAIGELISDDEYEEDEYEEDELEDSESADSDYADSDYDEDDSDALYEDDYYGDDYSGDGELIVDGDTATDDDVLADDEILADDDLTADGELVAGDQEDIIEEGDDSEGDDSSLDSAVPDSDDALVVSDDDTDNNDSDLDGLSDDAAAGFDPMRVVIPALAQHAFGILPVLAIPALLSLPVFAALDAIAGGEAAYLTDGYPASEEYTSSDETDAETGDSDLDLADTPVDGDVTTDDTDAIDDESETDDTPTPDVDADNEQAYDEDEYAAGDSAAIPGAESETESDTAASAEAETDPDAEEDDEDDEDGDAEPTLNPLHLAIAARVGAGMTTWWGAGLNQFNINDGNADRVANANASRQLGVTRYDGDQHTLVRIDGFDAVVTASQTSIMQLVTTNFGIFARMGDGTVWSLGGNNFGTRGLDGFTTGTPAQPGSGVAGTFPANAALTTWVSDGTLPAGTNLPPWNSALGIAALQRVNFLANNPTQVRHALANAFVVNIAAGAESVYAVANSGLGFAWGNQTLSRLGNNTTSGQVATPQGLQQNDMRAANVIDIAAGSNFAFAIVAGTVKLNAEITSYVMGANGDRQEFMTADPDFRTVAYQIVVRNDGNILLRNIVVTVANGVPHIIPELAAGQAITLNGTVTATDWEFSTRGYLSRDVTATAAIGDPSRTTHTLDKQFGNVAAVVEGALGITIEKEAFLDLPPVAMNHIVTWGHVQRGSINTQSTTVLNFDFRNQPNVDPHAYVTQIASGNRHFVALLSDGSVWVWGDNQWNSTLSNAHSTNRPSTNPWRQSFAGNSNFTRNTPVRVPFGADWNHATASGETWGNRRAVQVRAGWRTSWVLADDGTVWAFGDNYAGQHGVGVRNTSSGNGSNGQVSHARRVQFPAGTQIVDVINGNWFVFALDSNGNMWQWGRNWGGGLGLGTSNTNYNLTPVLVNLPPGFVHGSAAGSDIGVHKVIAKADVVFIQGTDGSLWGRGRNDRGQLGRGFRGNSSVPANQRTGGIGPGINTWGRVNIDLDGHEILAISAAPEYVFALVSDGSLWSWGRNTGGVLGRGYTGERPTVQQIAVFMGIPNGANLSNAAAVTATGVANTNAARDAWHDDPRRVSTPAALAAETIVQISATTGYRDNVMVRTATGQVWSWGQGGDNRTGHGTNAAATRSIPAQITSNVAAVPAIGFASQTAFSALDIMDIAQADYAGAAIIAPRLVPFNTITASAIPPQCFQVALFSGNMRTGQLRPVPASREVSFTYYGDTTGVQVRCLNNRGRALSGSQLNAAGLVAPGVLESAVATQQTGLVPIPAGEEFVGDPSQIIWRYTVTNTGRLPLSGITVSDMFWFTGADGSLAEGMVNLVPGTQFAAGGAPPFALFPNQSAYWWSVNHVPAPWGQGG
ncbi:MAG: hypothetical protein LBB58_01055 [Cellulomonadaceae bacterium]|jgi:alpha-tubulin suppressor-like RCC1 family protein|nr:hypothetical protein [Cellulomonadaceae bacterium]